MTTRTNRDKWRLISLIAAVVLAACVSPGDALIGEWQSSTTGVVFEFFKDGTVTWDQANRSFTGQYKFLDDHNLRLDMLGDLGPQAVVLKDVNIAGDTLTVIFEGKTIEFTRVMDGAQVAPPPPQPTVPAARPAGELKTESFRHPLGKIRTVKAQLQFSGEVQLYALTNQENLVEGQAAHDVGTLDFGVQEAGEQAVLKVGLKGVAGANSSNSQGQTWTVGLNSVVTYDLSLDLGAGKCVLDLSQLNLSHARINSGAGEVELRLPGKGKFTLNLDGGVSKTRILAPADIAMKVTVDPGLGTFEPGGRLLPDGADTYTTPDFGSAANSITLKISVGVGDISIEDVK